MIDEEDEELIKLQEQKNCRNNLQKFKLFEIIASAAKEIAFHW